MTGCEGELDYISFLRKWMVYVYEANWFGPDYEFRGDVYMATPEGTVTTLRMDDWSLVFDTSAFKIWYNPWGS